MYYNMISQLFINCSYLLFAYNVIRKTTPNVTTELTVALYKAAHTTNHTKALPAIALD